LEGSLIRILAYSSYNKLNPEEIDVNTVSEILSDMISEKLKSITLDSITQQVCKRWEISMPQMLEKSRKASVAFPRQVAMYLASYLIPQLSLKDIAEYYNRKDHTTVLHAKKMIENRFREDQEFREKIELMIKDIRN